MIGFGMLLLRFGRMLVMLWRDLRFRGLAAVALLQLVSGTIFYWQVEGWSAFDALYFCVMTLTTVGYGDLAPVTQLGKAFTMLYVLLGIGVFVAFVTVMAERIVQERVQSSRANDER